MGTVGEWGPLVVGWVSTGGGGRGKARSHTHTATLCASTHAVKRREGGIITTERKRGKNRTMKLPFHKQFADDVTISLKNRIQSVEGLPGD